MIGNLGEGAVAQRLRQTIMAMTVTVGLFVALVPADVPAVVRAVVFIPAFMGTVGAFSALYRI